FFAAHRNLHSFPTRRSSDLERRRISLSRCNRQASFASPRADVSGQTLRQQPRTLEGIDEEIVYRRHHAPHSPMDVQPRRWHVAIDRKSTRLNSSHVKISYAV